MLDQIGLLVLLLLVLAYSAGWVIRALVEIGRRFRISEFVLGFVVIGLATSLPELSVAINSIVNQSPGLAIGNLVGASLVLLSLIVGLAAVLQRGILLGHALRSRDLLIGSALIAAPIFMLINGRLSLIEGWFLMISYAAYLWYLYVYRVEIALRSLGEKRIPIKSLLTGAILGLIGLVMSAYYIVKVGTSLADTLSLPPLVIGVLILGIGTNLPEIALVLKARKASAQKLVLGDLMGSAAANTMIMGIIGAGGSYTLAEPGVILVAGVFLFTIILLFNVFIRTKSMLSPAEGLVLLLAYLLFVGLQIFS